MSGLHARLTAIESFGKAQAPRLLGILRMVSSILFLENATAKLFHFPYVSYYVNVTFMSLKGISGLCESIGASLLLIGCFSRTVAFILSGEMAVDYFVLHAPIAFYPVQNDGELAIIYCFLFLYIAAQGPGAWSIGGLQRERQYFAAPARAAEDP